MKEYSIITIGGEKIVATTLAGLVGAIESTIDQRLREIDDLEDAITALEAGKRNTRV